MFLYSMMVYTYKILLDITKDLENRTIGCNKISYGKDRKNSIIDKYPDVAQYLQGKSVDQAKDYMIPFLEKIYDQERNYIKKVSDLIDYFFQQHIVDACNIIEKITQRPLYINNFIVYLTTFPRGPYNDKEGWFLFCIYWDVQNVIGSFLHEVLHFQFLYYFKENNLVKQLTFEQYQMLKESLTVILNEEAKELLFKEDRGYPLHQEFRKLLLSYRKKDKNFGNLIEFGVRNIGGYIN